jgi:hypothetical protein
MTYYTATYQPAHNRWELRTPTNSVAVAYNCDLHPTDTDGAREWVKQAVTDFDSPPAYVGVTNATLTVYASTSAEETR